MKVSIRLVSSTRKDAKAVAKRGDLIEKGFVGEMSPPGPVVGLSMYVVDREHSATHDYDYRTSPVASVKPIEHGWEVTTANSVYRVIRKKVPHEVQSQSN